MQMEPSTRSRDILIQTENLIGFHNLKILKKKKKPNRLTKHSVHTPHTHHTHAPSHHRVAHAEHRRDPYRQTPSSMVLCDLHAHLDPVTDASCCCSADQATAMHLRGLLHLDYSLLHLDCTLLDQNPVAFFHGIFY